MTDVTILDLLDDAAPFGRIRFLNESADPVPLAELWRRSEGTARWARAVAGSGGRVAMVLSSTPDCVAAMLGTWRAGATVVSLPHPGRGSSIEMYIAQLAEMGRLAAAAAVLVDPGYESMLTLDIPVLPYPEATARGGPIDDAAGGDLIQFTSGSTARPKGVVLTSSALASNVESILEALEVAPGDSACSWLPLSHDMGLIGMLLASCAAMGPRWKATELTLIDPQHFLANPSSWLKACSEFQSAVTTAPNFAFDLAIRRPEWLSGLDLSSIRVCITGAERVLPATLSRFEAAVAPAGFRPGALCPSYGLAEATLAVCMVRPTDHWSTRAVAAGPLGDLQWVEVDAEGAAGTEGAEDDASISFVSNGSPIPRFECRIDAPAGTVGQIEIRGPSLLTGFLGAEFELTPDGWYATGDLGQMVDGELYVVGRIDDMLIVGGRNLFAQDIEGAIDQPVIRSGNCVAVPDTTGRYVVVLEGAASTTLADISSVRDEIVAGIVRAVGVAPSALHVVERGSLPKTPSGKLQRHRVAALLHTGELPIVGTLEGGGS